jgi:hypothetical protein
VDEFFRVKGAEVIFIINYKQIMKAVILVFIFIIYFIIYFVLTLIVFMDREYGHWGIVRLQKYLLQLRLLPKRYYTISFNIFSYATLFFYYCKGRYLGRLFNAIADDLYKDKLLKEGDTSVQPVMIDNVLAAQTKFEYPSFLFFSFLFFSFLFFYKHLPSCPATFFNFFIFRFILLFQDITTMAASRM